MKFEMRKMFSLALGLVIGVAFLGSDVSYAQRRVGRGNHRVDRRERRQAERIEQGVESGELTGKEAKGLIKDQKRIRRFERKAKADGNFTPEEKAKLERMQDKESAKIYREKHDADKRPGAPANDAAPHEEPAPVEAAPNQ